MSLPLSSPPTDSFDFEAWKDAKLSGTPPPPFQVASAGHRLNRLGIGRGQIVVIGGHPGTGKTALAQQLAFDALRQAGQSNLRAAIVSVEMSSTALLDRELARTSGVPYSMIANVPIAPEVMDRIRAGIGDMRKIVNRSQLISPPFTCAAVMKQIQAYGPDIVVIDYIQRLRAAAGDAKMQVSETMEMLRGIAGSGVAVIAVAALNRNGYAGSSASAADFRDSSEVEYGADAAYILVRQPSSASATLRCVKRRFGAPEDTELHFNGDRQLFTLPEEAE